MGCCLRLSLASNRLSSGKFRSPIPSHSNSGRRTEPYAAACAQPETLFHVVFPWIFADSFNDIFVYGAPIVVIVQCVASCVALRQNPRPQDIHLASNTTELNRESHC